MFYALGITNWRTEMLLVLVAAAISAVAWTADLRASHIPVDDD